MEAGDCGVSRSSGGSFVGTEEIREENCNELGSPSIVIGVSFLALLSSSVRKRGCAIVLIRPGAGRVRMSLLLVAFVLLVLARPS